MPRRPDRIITEDGIELPYEYWILAQREAARTGKRPEDVLRDYLGRLIDRHLKDPEKFAIVDAHIKATERYCEAEGLDMDAYTFSRAQMIARRKLKAKKPLL